MGSAYSDVCIKNIEDSHITLADDFLDAAPAMIFDSHFTNRGRLGRLVAFMASYEKEKNKRIMGVGVDETTALGITKDKLGIVFGTRSVSFYKLPEEENFGPGPALSARNINYYQLVHGDTIDLKTMEVYGLPNKVNPSVPHVHSGQVLFLSGSDEPASLNKAMLEKFVLSGEGKDQEIIIITGASITGATEFQSILLDLEAENVSIVKATFDFAEDPYTQAKIENATKILFADNSTYNFNVFLNSGSNGEILLQKLKEPGLILGFIGDNSRYAGSQIVNNYLSGGSNISLTKGLDLLNGLCIIPKTFDPPGGATDAWYSSHLAIPFAMISEELPFGLWLNNDNYVVFATTAGENLLTAYGNSPAIFLEMQAGRAGFTKMTYNGQNNEIPIPIAGFDNMKLSFLPDGESVNPGSPVPVQYIAYPMDEVQIYPNPVSDYLLLPNTNIPDHITIRDLHGRVLLSVLPSVSISGINVGSLKPGIYFLECSVENRKTFSRFIKLDE
jgi:cyanophycinase-like exopeptidase